MPIDSTLPPRSQGILREVSLFPFDSSEKEPARIAQKMLHQPEPSGAKRIIAANYLDPTKKRHLEEVAGSTFHKKMRKEEPSSAVKSVAKLKAVRKKRKLVSREWGFESPKNKCDLARRAFYRTLMFESMKPGNTKWVSNNVHIISSSLLDAQKKHIFYIQAFLWIREKYPSASVHFSWIDIPHSAFYELNNFKKMEDALYSIPFHSRIFIHDGNRLVTGKKQKQLVVKKPRKSIADKIIVFDPHGSAAIVNLFISFQLQNPHIPHHYITTGSSLQPFNRLTERSLVYFSNKDALVIQSTKMLTARGFRVIHSLKK